MAFTYEQVRDFLNKEARYLDDRDFEAWVELYDKNIQFWVPSWNDDGELTRDPQKEVSLMFYAHRDGLEDRVFRIRTERSTASTPNHRTSHNLSNIEIVESDEDSCLVRFNWITFTCRYKITDHFFGTSKYRLIKGANGEMRIKEKTVVLKNDCIHQVLDIYHI